MVIVFSGGDDEIKVNKRNYLFQTIRKKISSGMFNKKGRVQAAFQ
jgi:hypothetical protein